jgi:hypothetical protein
VAFAVVEVTLDAVGFEILEATNVTAPLEWAIIGAPVPEPPRLVAAMYERPDHGDHADRWRAAFELLLEAGQAPEEVEPAS